MLKDLYLTLFGSLLPETLFARDNDYRSAILNVLVSPKNNALADHLPNAGSIESITQKWIDADRVIIDFSEKLWNKFYRVKSSKDQQLIINAAINCLSDRIATHDAIIYRSSDREQWLQTLHIYATLTFWLVAWRSMNYHWEQNETCKRALTILTLLDDTDEAIKVKHKGMVTSINDHLAIALFTPCMDLSSKRPQDIQRAFNVIKGSMAGMVFMKNTSPNQLKFSATHLIIGKDCRIAYRPHKIDHGEWHIPLRPLLESIIDRSMSEIDEANNLIIDEALNIELRYHQFKRFPDTPYTGRIIAGIESIFKTFTSRPDLPANEFNLLHIQHAGESLSSFRIQTKHAYRPSPGQLIVIVVNGNYSLGKILSVRNESGDEYLIHYELKSDCLQLDTLVDTCPDTLSPGKKQQACIHFHSSNDLSKSRSIHIITEDPKQQYTRQAPVRKAQLTTTQVNLQFEETVDSGDGWVEHKFKVSQQA
jgi:hypothetical protein